MRETPKFREIKFKSDHLHLKSFSLSICSITNEVYWTKHSDCANNQSRPMLYRGHDSSHFSALFRASLWWCRPILTKKVRLWMRKLTTAFVSCSMRCGFLATSSSPNSAGISGTLMVTLPYAWASEVWILLQNLAMVCTISLRSGFTSAYGLRVIALM